MRTCLLFLVALSLSVLGRAQARKAFVELENGAEVAGRVVAMDLKQLQLVVDDQIVTIEAADIKNCRFEEIPEAAGAPQLPPPAPIGETAPQPVRTAAAPAAVPAAPGSEPAPAGAAPPAGQELGEKATAKKSPAAAAALVFEPAAAPPKARTLLGARIAAVDRAYPWLCPANPAQWASLGLLLLSGLSLIIHISVVVAGAETAQFGRSLGLSFVYLLAGFAQMAFVPGGHLAVFSMLIGNTAVALFSLRALFGLARGSTFVAFAVQLGFVTVGWGVLELVNSLLGSVAPA